MNTWRDTRKKLLDLIPEADLPEEWQSGIDLSFAAWRRGKKAKGHNRNWEDAVRDLQVAYPHTRR